MLFTTMKTQAEFSGLYDQIFGSISQRATKESLSYSLEQKEQFQQDQTHITDFESEPYPNRLEHYSFYLPKIDLRISIPS